MDRASAMVRRVTTIRDVAERAGVSRQTVSRAINDKGEISPETRARVLEIAREMGYWPNRLARGLRTQRTQTIGLVVPDIANPFFAEVARGASEVAYGEGYSVVLSNTNEQPDREQQALRTLASHQVDGLLLVSSRLDEDQLEEAAKRWRPMVLVNRRISAIPGVASVMVDDVAAAVEAVRYLASTGRSPITFLSGLPGSRSGAARREGFTKASAEEGLADATSVYCAPTFEGGLQAAMGVLRGQPKPGALLAYNDLVALGALEACRRSGVAVPEDCAVVGWDDVIFAAYVWPSLTTVRQPKSELGARAMLTLLSLINDPDTAPATVQMRAELVVRGSA
ncbi:MAG: LacI family DNA-binding transcriptional regulator [Anaerolineae bacterium]